MALVSKLRQIGKRQWVIILGAFLGCVFIFLIVAGYWLHWTGLGFSNKTLWDWMQLLIIPTTLALVAILFNRAERKNEQVIASDNQREATLEAYLSRLSELFLERDLTTSKPDAKVLTVARAWTLEALSRLDGNRKGSLFRFLYESGLTSILYLNEADLSGANISGANLREAKLRTANLSEANLSGVVLTKADLLGANLRGANLSRATLHGAELSGADLTGANLEDTDLTAVRLIGAKYTEEQLSKARWKDNITR